MGNVGGPSPGEGTMTVPAGLMSLALPLKAVNPDLINVRLQISNESFTADD